MPTQPIPSLRAQRDLRKLGNDISIARKRRQFTQRQLAQAASVNVATVRRLERGDQGVSLGTLAMVLLVLGESQRIADLLDVARDDVGLVLSVTAMPKRVRGPNRKRRENADGEGATSAAVENEPIFEGW
jgi:transcriptional regulator with XRE-family HTH domain